MLIAFSAATHNATLAVLLALIAAGLIVALFNRSLVPFAGLAFKIATDPFVGKLIFFRVYSGQLKKGDTIYNPRTRKRERVSRVMMIQADKRIDVETTFAGDIAALVGLRNITTGDTLCDEDFDVALEPPTFPERGDGPSII